MANAAINRDILLANIASLYFLEKKTQAQIAKQMGYSRSAISRMITEAENRGIVEIRVLAPIKRNKELESFIQNKYGIEEVLIVAGKMTSELDRLREVGQLAAGFVEKYLHDNTIIGIGWGTSIYETVNALPNLALSDVQVVQVIGAIAGKSDPKIDGPEVAALLARKLNGSHHFLHSPLILEEKRLKQALIKQTQILEVIDLAYQAEITLLGIGSIEPDPEGSSLLRTGYINKKDVQELKEKGGAANFCGYILNQSGDLLADDINQRVMAVNLNDLRKSRSHIIAVAAGKKKAKAIQAVLEGKLVDTLISDSEAVYPIFEEHRKRVENGEK